MTEVTNTKPPPPLNAPAVLIVGAGPTGLPLACVPPGLRTLQVVGQPAGPDDIADTGGHLASAYGATGRTLVLIRPDGYIGLISDAGDVSAVSDYLAAIG